MVEDVVETFASRLKRPYDFSLGRVTILAQTLIMMVCVRDCAWGWCLPVTESCCWVEG